MDHRAILLTALLASAPISAAVAAPIPNDFKSSGQDKKAIADLLQAYTSSVSNKNQDSFESLLLSKTIPFERVEDNSNLGEIERKIKNYDDFRRVVFEGKPFVQSFEHIHVMQEGTLADVTLVFVNIAVTKSEWGWKTLHLVKVATGWKIASEFFTLHPK